MKCTLFPFLFCIVFPISAQNNWHIKGQGFNSCFQMLENGSFRGYVDGLMQFKYIDGRISLASFSKDSSQLIIVPDSNKVYDVSFKNYYAKNNDIQIEYNTYNLANAISITIDGKKYTLSLFDGACRDVINGLKYDYILNGETELLIIHFSDIVKLSDLEGNTPQVLYILKGSTLIFTIFKQNSEK